MEKTGFSVIEDCLKHKQYLVRLNIFQGRSYSCFLPKQVQALKKSVCCDTLVVLPTGYGKSLIFQALPYTQVPSSTVIVVSPLNAIIMEQERKLKECIHINGQIIDALLNPLESQLGPLTEEAMEMKTKIEKFKRGKFLYIIGHPEHLLNTAVKSVLSSKSWKDKVSHIVVDEAHCILSWGKSQFRPSFLQLKSLRAWHPKAKLLAMTATASVQSQKEIMKALVMEKAAIISVAPDR